MNDYDLGTLRELYPNIILYDDLEDAFLGVCLRFGQEPVAMYDYDTCIEIRMRDGASYEEACEFHEHNTMSAWVGDRTPAFLKAFDSGNGPHACIRCGKEDSETANGCDYCFECVCQK